MNKSIRALLFTLFLVSALYASTAVAGSAQSFLEAKQRTLTSLVKKPQTSGTDKKIADTFDALLDYGAFAKNSLADNWDEISQEERDEFQKLLTTLVRRSYSKNLRDTLHYRIEFKGEKKGKVGQLVSTIAKHKTDARKESIEIDYLLHQKGAGWLVFDIITEGESLVRNYKSQFRRVIKKKGFSGLLDRMRKKVNKG